MPSIDAEAAKLAGLHVDLLQKYRAGQIALADLEWWLGLKCDERQGLMLGRMRERLSPPPPLDSLIRVDRTVRPPYPDWVKMAMHPELELTGPAEFDASSLEQYRHKKQKTGTIGGHDLYKHLKNKKMLEGCVGLTDLLAIQAKGIDFFRQHFAGKAVFGWKSVVQNADGSLFVPYLFEHVV